jgi:hypothetical protein
VSGVWSLVQQQEHINMLDMRAVLLALQHFKTLLVSKAVVLRTGVVECEGDLEEPHRLENSESPVVERIVEP